MARPRSASLRRRCGNPASIRGNSLDHVYRILLYQSNSHLYRFFESYNAVHGGKRRIPGQLGNDLSGQLLLEWWPGGMEAIRKVHW